MPKRPIAGREFSGNCRGVRSPVDGRLAIPIRNFNPNRSRLTPSSATLSWRRCNISDSVRRGKRPRPELLHRPSAHRNRVFSDAETRDWLKSLVTVYTQHRLILRNCAPKVGRSDLRIATVGNRNSLLPPAKPTRHFLTLKKRNFRQRRV